MRVGFGKVIWGVCSRVLVKLEAELTMWPSHCEAVDLEKRGPPIGALERPLMSRLGGAGVSVKGTWWTSRGTAGGGARQARETVRWHRVPCACPVLPSGGGGPWACQQGG